MTKLKLLLFSILMLLQLNNAYAETLRSYAENLTFIYDGHNSMFIEGDEQFAQIKYENGIESLSFSLNFSNINEMKDAYWIYPIPASLNDIKCDVNAGAPFLAKCRIDASKYAKYLLVDHFKWTSLSQIYPLAVFDFRFLNFEATIKELYSKINKLENNLAQMTHYSCYGRRDITNLMFFDHDFRLISNEFGLKHDLVSFKKSNDLIDYMKSKNIFLSDQSVKLFDDYINKNYAFVVLWFKDPVEFKFEKNKRTRNVNVLEVNIDFKTPKIFVPLKILSLNGNSNLPVKILVKDYVTPELYPNLICDTYKGKKTQQISYFLDHDYKSKYYTYEEFYQIIPNIYIYSIDNIYNCDYSLIPKYTLINVDVPAKKYTDDLWISSSTPVVLMFNNFIINNNKYVFLIYFVLLSCISSLLAGELCYKKFKPSKRSFFILGIYNMFTLIGILIVSYILKINKRYLNIRYLTPDSSDKPVGILVFILAFTAIFIEINVLFFTFLIYSLRIFP